MFEKLITVFKIPAACKKIVLTRVLLAVYRTGFWISRCRHRSGAECAAVAQKT